MRHNRNTAERTVSDSLPTRRSARLMILDPLGRLLLFRYQDGLGDPFWSTVGGELRDDEDYRMAAARELEEETGFDAPIGHFLRERDDVYAIARAEPARWLEHYYLVQCASSAPPDRAGWTEEERATIKNWRWWSLDEMRRDGSVFRPGWLPDLLEKTLAQISNEEPKSDT